MIRQLITLSALCLATAAQADSLSEGNYTGKGLWRSSQEQGQYEVGTQIQGTNVSTIYKLPDGSEKSWAFNIQSLNNGFFAVEVEGESIGSGYCLSEVILCHYQIKTDDIELEETLTVQEGKLYKYGSKSEDNEKIFWQEALNLAK